MEPDDTRLIALVNLLANAAIGYPDPDDADPIGPWGPWIREAQAAQHRNAAGYWWQDVHPGPPPYWVMAGLAGLFDNELNPGRPGPNWVLAALLRDLAFLNPQPLPPIDTGIAMARNLGSVVLRRAGTAGAGEGSDLLRRFAADWCGNEPIIPKLPKKGDPGEPRPPRPEESLVLGAALVRAARTVADAALQKAADAAGRRIFQHGLSGL